MQDNHSFEYAVIRIVPQVEREEFLNAGIILYCRQRQFLQVKFSLDEGRILALNAKADIEAIRSHLQAFKKISEGQQEAGPIAMLDLASRFRWLTAKRSTVIQSSEVHPGLSRDPAATLEKLHNEFVLPG